MRINTISLTLKSSQREHKGCWFSRAQVPKENIGDAVSELTAGSVVKVTRTCALSLWIWGEEQTDVFTEKLS